MGKDDQDTPGQDRPDLHDREHVGIVGGAGATFVGIDAKHLDVDGHDERDEKTHHDRSWKTRTEEEPGAPADAAEAPGEVGRA